MLATLPPPPKGNDLHVVIDIAIIIGVIYLFKRRATARAIYKTGDRTVWSNASDARFPRTPRSWNPFGRKRGMQ